MFINKTNHEIVKLSVDKCNELIKDPKFLASIIRKDSFYMSNATAETIAFLIKQFSNGIYGSIEVYTYYPKWRWSKALGYFNPNKPSHIYLNAYKLNRSLASVCASLTHEMVHYLDHKSDFSFGHGNNNPNGKSNTAPYWIDNLTEKMIELNDVIINYENGNIKVYKPWWEKLWNKIF